MLENFNYGAVVVSEGGGFTITASVIDPIVKTVTDNVAILLPAGLALTALVIGAKLIPKLFKSFVKA